MDEYRHKISVGKQDTESGFIRLFVAICLVMVGFFIAFWLMQSVHQRMSSSSLMDRLPIVLVLLILCAAVFAYVRIKRGGSKDPDGKKD